MIKPKVIKMSFLNRSMLGFPVLPICLEGNETFSAENSIYEWEEKGIQNDHSESSKQRKLKLENRVFFTPKEETNVGKVFCLTCTPWNTAGTISGDPLTAETAPITVPPIDSSKYLFRQRITKSKLDDKSGLGHLEYFRVVQYNVLAGYLATESHFGPSCPPESLPNDYRLPILNLELQMYQGDIITLQEIEESCFKNYYKPFLSHECALEGEFYCKAENGKDGLATFFNREKFQLVETNRAIIRDEMRLCPFFKHIKDEKLLNQLSIRINVLLVTLLWSKVDPGIMLLVANTHLYSRADCEHIRLLQMMTCTDYMERLVTNVMKRNQGVTPVILLCGDLNCRPSFGAIRFLTTGVIQGNDPDWTSKDYGTVDPAIGAVHNSLQLTNTHASVGDMLTNIVKSFEGCLDYIFYERDSVLELVKIHPPLTKTEIGEITGVKADEVFLPNFYAPSDHLPVIADFRLPLQTINKKKFDNTIVARILGLCGCGNRRKPKVVFG